MKYIYYKLRCGVLVPDERGELVERETEGIGRLPYSTENLERAKAAAVDGKYTIEDDGEPELEQKQTPEQRIAELEEALALLLTGVTE